MPIPEATPRPYTPLPETPLDNLSTEQLEQAIQIAARGEDVNVPGLVAKPDNTQGTQATNTPVTPAVQTDKVGTSPAQPVQATQGVEQPKATEQTPVGNVPQAQPVEQASQIPALTKEQLDDLLAKKKIAPEQLAKIYVDLEKDYHKKSQELSQLRQAQIAPQVPIAQPDQIPGYQQQYVDPNQAFMDDLNRAPIDTIKKVVEILLNPVAQETKAQKLHTTVVELSSSPETAEFNLPEVQDEIKKVLDEKPHLKSDLAVSLPEVTDMAIGRLYRTGKLKNSAVDVGRKIAEQNQIQRQNAGMESGQNRPPAPPAPFDPTKASEQELWNKILEISGQISR